MERDKRALRRLSRVDQLTGCLNRRGFEKRLAAAIRAGEPFGLATLEAMASARSVVATGVGGPPEFVTPEAGVLVDPTDDDALLAALSEAAALPRPNLAGRAVAGEHDVKRQAERVEEILLRASRDRRA